MRFNLETASNKHVIQGYAHGQIQIGEREIRRSVIVTPERLLDDWPPQDFAHLEAEHFTLLVALQPQIVLLGTGARQRFPQAPVLRVLLQAGIGVEVMDTYAACRTYNLLMMEGRLVAAALLLEG